MNSDIVDSSSLLLSGVFGLVIFYAMTLMATGSARARNAAATSLNHLLILGCSVIAVAGIGHLFLEGKIPSAEWRSWLFSGSQSGGSFDWDQLLFQVMIVSIALSIVYRAMIDRVRLRGVFVFALIFSSIVFPVLVQWGWGTRFGAGNPGWLEIRGAGFHDFGGAGIIHVTAGAFALAGALVAGVRRGHLLSGATLSSRQGHQPVMISLGATLMLIGWLGWHYGLEDGSSGGKVIVITLLAAAAACLSSMILYRIMFGAVGFHTTVQGLIGGLIASSACATSMSVTGALFVGAVAGVVLVLASLLIEKLCIDDAGGVIPAHLVCGLWGVLAAALVGPPEIRTSRGMLTQATGGFSLCLTSFLIGAILLKLIDNLFGLRMSAEDEKLGGDFTEHSLNAYPDFDVTERR